MHQRCKKRHVHVLKQEDATTCSEGSTESRTFEARVCISENDRSLFTPIAVHLLVLSTFGAKNTARSCIFLSKHLPVPSHQRCSHRRCSHRRCSHRRCVRCVGQDNRCTARVSKSKIWKQSNYIDKARYGKKNFSKSKNRFRGSFRFDKY